MDSAGRKASFRSAARNAVSRPDEYGLSGTSVVSGTGHALVVATGTTTEVGRITALIETAAAGQTPLERQLDRVGRRLLWASVAIVALVFLLGLLRGVAPFEMFLEAVSLAVAAIPKACRLGYDRACTWCSTHGRSKRTGAASACGRNAGLCASHLH